MGPFGNGATAGPYFPTPRPTIGLLALARGPDADLSRTESSNSPSFFYKPSDVIPLRHPALRLKPHQHLFAFGSATQSG
jgi:hypothetical protein